MAEPGEQPNPDRLFSEKFLVMPKTDTTRKQFSGGTVTNIEKDQKEQMEHIVEAGSSLEPTWARASHLIGRSTAIQQNDCRVHPNGTDDRGQPVIVRLEDLPATPHNLERIRERVRILNQQLAASGTPLRLRVV